MHLTELFCCFINILCPEATLEAAWEHQERGELRIMKLQQLLAPCHRCYKRQSVKKKNTLHVSWGWSRLTRRWKFKGSRRTRLWLPKAQETSSPDADSKFKANSSAGSLYGAPRLTCELLGIQAPSCNQDLYLSADANALRQLSGTHWCWIYRSRVGF